MQYNPKIEASGFDVREWNYALYNDISPRDLADAFAEVTALRVKMERVATELSRGHRSSHSETGISIESEIKNRARRKTALPAELFSEPAWDILLELYQAELGQYRVNISKLCMASEVPATTGLRWIQTLEAKGLIGRCPDPFDARRVYIHLTESGSRAMGIYFSNGKRARS